MFVWCIGPRSSAMAITIENYVVGYVFFFLRGGLCVCVFVVVFVCFFVVIVVVFFLFFAMNHI